MILKLGIFTRFHQTFCLTLFSSSCHWNSLRFHCFVISCPVWWVSLSLWESGNKKMVTTCKLLDVYLPINTNNTIDWNLLLRIHLFLQHQFVSPYLLPISIIRVTLLPTPHFKILVISFALTSTSKKSQYLINLTFRVLFNSLSSLHPFIFLISVFHHFKLGYFSEKKNLLTIIQESRLSALLAINYIVNIWPY